MDKLNKNKKMIKEILKPNFKKIIVFLALMYITAAIFNLRFYGPFNYFWSPGIIGFISPPLT